MANRTNKLSSELVGNKLEAAATVAAACCCLAVLMLLLLPPAWQLQVSSSRSTLERRKAERGGRTGVCSLISLLSVLSRSLSLFLCRCSPLPRILRHSRSGSTYAV